MTADSILTSPPAVLVWDASPLHHALKANHADTLSDICSHYRNVTTSAVLQELDYYDLPTQTLTWLEIVHVDGLDELQALVEWMGRVGGSASNQGEATVLAWAAVHGATPVIDDGDARRVALRHGVPLCGSLRLIADAIGLGRLTEYSATRLVDELLDTGARYPCERGGFAAWACKNGLVAT